MWTPSPLLSAPKGFSLREVRLLRRFWRLALPLLVPFACGVGATPTFAAVDRCDPRRRTCGTVCCRCGTALALSSPPPRSGVTFLVAVPAAPGAGRCSPQAAPSMPSVPPRPRQAAPAPPSAPPRPSPSPSLRAAPGGGEFSRYVAAVRTEGGSLDRIWNLPYVVSPLARVAHSPLSALCRRSLASCGRRPETTMTSRRSVSFPRALTNGVVVPFLDLWASPSLASA
mmetsp:Transcript_16880/g.51892  ORF Transcript_16880/g.51892 Transcript_16880/m.51892 type:complete len:227 (-) Transcript_16880:134-814(-)